MSLQTWFFFLTFMGVAQAGSVRALKALLANKLGPTQRVVSGAGCWGEGWLKFPAAQLKEQNGMTLIQFDSKVALPEQGIGWQRDSLNATPWLTHPDLRILCGSLVILGVPSLFFFDDS